MSKRDITYVKPQDPTFLQQLKQQIGYKEGPSVETKKQKLEDLDGDIDIKERAEREDEKPQIVVINSGDLTAEEVAIEEKRLAREAAEVPADLSKHIIFRKRHKPSSDLAVNTNELKNKPKQSKLREKLTSRSTAKLSFNTEEDEEDQ